MYFAVKPPDEEMRLSDLMAYDLLDTPAEKDFDNLVELATILCNCPISTITFIDKERQWFKARKGVPVQETVRDTALCSHAILSRDPLILEDARSDPRFSHYPDVRGGLGIRLYAGVPIISSAGYALGSICVIDRQPRQLTTEQIEGLVILARQVSRLLELRLKSKVVEQHAEKRIKQQQIVLRTTLQEQDMERQNLGEELHENVAQVLASTMHYLHMAEQTPELQPQLVHKAHRQVKEALAQVRNLSRTVHPFPLDLIELGPLLAEFLEERSQDLPYLICFEPRSNRSVPKEASQPLFRILEQLLQLASYRNGVHQVHLDVDVQQELSISFIYDGHNWEEGSPWRITLHTLQNRTETYGGSIQAREHPLGQVINIYLPL